MAYTTIDDPTLHFSTTLWSGNSTDDRDIVVAGTGMRPDWVWIKERSSTGYHFTFDSTRGATKNIHTNVTQAESTQANALQTFNSNGFEIGTDGDINNSGDTYVGWTWKANGGTTSSNSDGSITSTVQANTTAGFSIVSYTGTSSVATVGHGLGVTPGVFITKCRSNSSTSWGMYHQSVGNTAFMELNGTAAKQTNSGYFNNTSPTSSVFTIGNYSINNGDGLTFIGYCFAEKKGYSKFGSYTGNGNANGPFVYTGFKPAWLMIKVFSGNTGGWDMYDNKRGSYNGQISMIQANATAAEATADGVDFLSNGFKIRHTSGNQNGSGNSHIYMAFAEAPFVNSNGVPANAR